MKKTFTILFASIAFLWGSIRINAQSTETIIKGKLTDENSGEAIVGAVILVKGTKTAVQTDTAGKYEIRTTQPTPFVVQISFVGYKTKEVEVYEDSQDLNFTLGSNLLNEVVVVGYGEQDRKSLTGSISKIDPQDTKQQPVASFNAQLQGQAPGVQVNTFSGMPGEGVRLQVRGASSINSSNDPLYVIDGVFANNNTLTTIDLGSKYTSPLADINPADIENIEILKDASAIAIYGSRGANGVVLVTTKRGDYDATKPKFNFNMYEGWTWADPSRLWKLTTGPEHATLVNEAYTNSGIENPNQTRYTFDNRPFQDNGTGLAAPFASGTAGNYRGTPEQQGTYDRLGKVFRTANVRNYDLNVQGGGKTSKYYIGVGYTDQGAILKPAGFQRGSFKFNFDTKLSSRVTFGSSNGVYYSYRQQVRGGAGQDAGFLLAALHSPTYFPFTNPDGTYSRGSLYESVDLLTDLNAANVSTTSLRYLGNQFLEVKILPDLKFKTSIGLDYNDYDEKEYFNDKTLIGGVRNLGGYKNQALSKFSVLLNEQTLSYNKALTPSHSIGILIGNGIQSTNIRYNQVTGSGFPNNSFQQISSAATTFARQTESNSALASFFGRLTYNYKGKYFIEGTFRADGSSKFGANNRWGYFPGVGIAWRVKEESFLKNFKYISELKIRISAGSSGNQNGIGDFGSLGLWSGNGQYPDNTTGGAQPGTAPAQLGNPNLKWERVATYNAGIDLGLFKDRVFVDFNAYYKYTTDALLNLPVPGATGYTSQLTNAAEISNKGIELALTTYNIKNKDLVWKTSINYARNVNNVEKLTNPVTFEARQYIIAQEGQALGSYWLYQQKYVDTQAGDAVFNDVNGDGQLNSADRLVLGNLFPKFFGGINNSVTYKGFDFGVLFTYQYGNSVFNFNKYILEGGGTRDASRSMLASQLDRWQKPGDVTNTPRLTFFGNNYSIEQNSRYLEDGSFIRLKAITLGYTLPKALSSIIGFEKIRVYASGTNLWIYTKYTGPDPESSGSAIQNLQGLDTATPPQPIGFQLGANLTF